MTEIKERLTDDAVAQRMLAQLEQGYTAPELAQEWLIYIKLNQLENRLELKSPQYISDPAVNSTDGYLGCPNCKKPIANVTSSRVYRPRFCHYCGQALDWERHE